MSVARPLLMEAVSITLFKMIATHRGPPAPHTMKKAPANHKVRTSKQDRTLDSMFPILNPSQSTKDDSALPAAPAKPPDIKVSECNLASVLQLRDEIDAEKHQGSVVSLLIVERRSKVVCIFTYRTDRHHLQTHICWYSRPKTVFVLGSALKKAISD